MKFDSQIVFYGTNDINNVIEFYEKIMGFELIIDQAICRIYKTALNSYVGFCEHIEVEECKSAILTFVIDNVDEVFAELVTKGVKVISEPKLNEKYKIYHCFLEDYDGYKVEIQRFEDTRWK